MFAENLLLSLPAFFQCPHCSLGNPMLDDMTLHYLKGAKIVCNACEQPVDWWKVSRKSIAENFMMNQAFAPLGARMTVFKLTLEKGKSTVYRFSDFGVPADARILYVNYTPHGTSDGSLAALELHGNVATHSVRGDEVSVFPMPIGVNPPQQNPVSVMVNWLEATPDNAVWTGLVGAFEAYVAGNYAAAIVPANVAVEANLSRFMFDYLVEQGISKQRVDDFLIGGATYSHQLNVLLPMVTSQNGLPQLSDDIRGKLNALRDLRNQVAHHGETEKPLSRSQVADVLTAALFGLRFVQLLRTEWDHARERAASIRHEANA